MRIPAIFVSALLVLAAVAALASGLSRRGAVTGSRADDGFPAAWSAGQFSYRTDVQIADCALRITTEVLKPEGFEAENRVLSAPLAELDPARFEAPPRNPVLGLPGLITINARPGETLRCELLAGGPCPTASCARAELPLPHLWADRPDDFARLIRADIEACRKK